MRPTSVLPAACAIIAITLSFLCLFAGSKRAYLEDYNILTLNTSRIGQNILNNTLGGGNSSGIIPDMPDIPNPFDSNGTDALANLTDPFSSWNSTNPFSSLLVRDLGHDINNLSSSIESALNSDLNSLVSSIAKDVGLADFYSAHLLTYCSGTYTPQAVPNASVPLSSIHKHVAGCSKPSVEFWFDPSKVLSDSLANATGLDITLDELDWPASITSQLSRLRTAWRAATAFYCLAIAFGFVALFAALAAFLTTAASSSSSSVVPIAHLVLHVLAFVFLLLASAVVTAVAVQGTHAINKFGNGIGVSATRGDGVMAMTGAGTGTEAVAVGWAAWMWWSGRKAARRGERRYEAEKLGGSPRREGYV